MALSMRRILSVVAVAALMAVMLVAMAAPAIASHQNCRTKGTIETCSGGEGVPPGGGGESTTIDRESGDFVTSGGEGGKGGGAGARCEGNIFGSAECSGRGYTGNQ
jgi:hypothetical protein